MENKFLEAMKFRHATKVFNTFFKDELVIDTEKYSASLMVP